MDTKNFIIVEKKLACNGFFATCFNRNGGLAMAKPQATTVADKMLVLSRFDVLIVKKKLDGKGIFTTYFNDILKRIKQKGDIIMTRAKKNLFVTVLAVMLVAVLTMTALVACGGETSETVKVTFKDGETVVASVDVAKGTTLELTKIPAAPVKDGYTFEGWYVGETKFDGTITFDADTVFTAKYEAIVPPAPETVSVTFKDGEADYKKVTVVKGEKIAAADLPTDPTAAPGYRFDGWYVGDTEFDEETAFSADATYTAKYTKVSYVVKFVNGEEEIVKLIAIADDAKLVADAIPADPEKEGFAFMGWYSGMNKAVADVEVTADVTYEAVFNNEASYNGYWVNTAEGKESMIFFDKDNGKVTYTSQFSGQKAYEYKAEEGTIVYSSGSFTSKKTYTFIAIGEKLVVTCSAYDDAENEFVTTEIDVLERKAGTGLGGVYAKAQKTNVITVEDNGIISKFGPGGSSIPYGVVYTTVENGVTVYHFDMRITAGGALKKLTAVVDENGNFVMSAVNEADASYEGIYAKDAVVTDFYYDGNYLVSFVKGDVTQYTYIVKNVGSYYATVTGNVEQNGEITVSYGEGLEAVYAITEMPTETTEGNMTPASSERGTYTGSAGSVYVDGFGKAVLTFAEGAAINYTYNIHKVTGNVILTDAEGNVIGVSFDADEHTYTILTADGKAGKYNQAVSGSTSYTLTIDGFGGATIAVKYSWSTTSTYYYGTYAYAENGASVTLEITNYASYNKTYSVEEEGNVLVSADGNIVFLAPGFTAEDKSEQFVGYFVASDGNAIEITSEFSGMWIRFNGADKMLSKNWNGTVLTFSAYDYDNANSTLATADADYTLKIVGEALELSHGHLGFNEDGYSEVSETKSVTYTKTTKPFSFAESARGTWYLSDNTEVVISESTITVGGVDGTDYNFVSGMGGDYYNFKINGTEYTIYEDYETAGKWYYGLASSYDAEELSATQHGTAETLDGLEGTYKSGTNVITLDGKGNGTYNNGTEFKFTYTGTGDTKKVSDFADYDDNENTITVTATGLNVHFSGSYGDDVYNASFTKEAASKPAAIGEDMQGTFTGNNGYTTNFTITVNADSIEYSEVDTTWGVDIKATITEYTIENEGYTIAWTRNGESYKFSSPMAGMFKLYIGSDDYTLTKGGADPALTEIPEAFIGTWKGADEDGYEYKYVITATSIEFTYDGGTPFSYNMESIEIAADGSKITISGDSYFTVTSTGLNVKDVYSGGTYVDVDLTKEAEEPAQPANAFVGTWSGKIGTANWTIVFNADGTFTANGTTYHYVVNTSDANKAESTEVDGSDKLFTFAILSNGKLRVERYDTDMYETYSGDLEKAA